MYCVKCGVKLQEGVESCPLCKTPVWNPDQGKENLTFPERYPEKKIDDRKRIAFFLTVVMILAEFVLFMIVLNVSDGWSWGGYAMLGVVLGSVVIVLPVWIKKMPAFIAIAVDHAAVAGYLLFVCLWSHGDWFLTFAFPIVAMNCLLTTAVAVLIRYTQRGRFFLFGGAIVIASGFLMLIEFFEHISFGSSMFAWSIYATPALFAVGFFMILAGIIPPLREFLKRSFFF